MKKWLFFIGGVATGIVLTIAVSFFIYNSDAKSDNGGESTTETETLIDSKEDDGITLFDEPGDIIKGKSFKVFQVIAPDAALVNGEDEDGYYFGPVCVLANKDGKYYYDEEIIEVPRDKVVRQVGVYRYLTKNDMYKTVPIIMILDK